jgi:hypothetical protein
MCSNNLPWPDGKEHPNARWRRSETAQGWRDFGRAEINARIGKCKRWDPPVLASTLANEKPHAGIY